MRNFSYYLFENFDADEEAQNLWNPRRFLDAGADAVLGEVAQYPPGCCPADLFGEAVLAPLLEGGVLRTEGGKVLFDSPVFLREDAGPLRSGLHAQAQGLADMLMDAVPALRACCGDLTGGFPMEEHLYHILCGMVFDGAFFNYLSERGAVSTSRLHRSGLDYLAVIYEKCTELEAFSDGLLCSYNRYTDGRCSLQSFGDANGDRFDFYRVARLREAGRLPTQFHCAEELFAHYPNKDTLLSQVRSLVETGHCDPAAMHLLTLFGYAADGKLCVPVYTQAARKAARQVEDIVEQRIGGAFVQTLAFLERELDITAVRHGVPPKEIANELYHILFGSLNEVLAARGIVAAPQNIPGQGRYLRCIELYNE